MTSTETTTTTKTSTAIATSGRSANIEDIYDENLLREMWQDMDDMDAKRQIRSRMYKLREERLKEFYGREGQDILENILKPASDEGIQGSSSMEGKRERTVVTTESRSVGGEEVTESRTIHAKQTVSTDGENVIKTIVTTTTTTTGGDDEEDEESNGRKLRIINKERTGQMQEIKNQQRSSGKRNVSTSEVTKPLSKRGSMDSDISVSRGSGGQNNNNQMKNKNMTNGVVSKRKQTTTTVTTGSGESGDGNVSETGATLSTAVVSLGKGERSESAEEGFGNKSVAALRRNFQQADFSTSSMSSRTMSSMSSTSVHMTSSSSVSSRAVRESSSSSSMIHPESGESSTRVVSSMRTVTTSESGGGMPLNADVNITRIETQVGGVVPPNEKLEVGRVLIKEIGAGGGGVGTAGNEMRFTATAQSQSSASSRSQFRSSSPITSRGDRCSKRQNSRGGGDANLINGTGGDTSNRSTIRTNSSSSITTGRSGRIRSNNETNEKMSSSHASANTTRSSSSNRNPSESTSSPSTNKTTPRSRSPSHPKHSTTTAVGRSGGTSSEVEEKVCRRANKLSGESSPKNRTTPRRQVPEDNLKQQQERSTSSSSSPTKTTTRTSSKTRITERHQQQQRQPTLGKKESSNVTTTVLTKGEPDKTTKSTEEKIMRELDSLDTFLSQRSASIDEGNREDSTPLGNTSPVMAKMNGAPHGEERMAKKTDKNFSLGKATRHVTTISSGSTTTSNKEVDVMESGVEAPFTRTTYKYNCPEDNHRHHRHHTPDHPTDKLAEKKNVDERKRSPKRGGPRPGAVSDKDDLEDQIITSPKTDDQPKSRVSPKPDSPAKTEKATRPKRPTSQSPEKPKKSVSIPSKKNETPKREEKEATISRTRAHTTQNSVTNTNQGEHKSSPGKRTPTQTNKTAPVSNTLLKKKNVQELTANKVDEVISSNNTSQSTSVIRQERKLINTSGMTEAEKYEADILSRPSVFAARRAVPAKGAASPAPEKPEPNQRSRRTPDSSPERDMPASTRRPVPQHTSSTSQHTKASSATREIVQDTLHAVEEVDEDNPLNPPKRFTTSGKYLESPGAVLKAKSLFENKAQEASKDRSSAELGSKVSTSPKLTVSRKAALFEARSRGERVSISSESEHSDDETGMDSATNSDFNEQKYKTCKVPEANERAVSMERRVSEVVSVIRKESKLIETEETVTTGNSVESGHKEIKLNNRTDSINEGTVDQSTRTSKVTTSRRDSGKLNKTSASQKSAPVTTPAKKPDSRSSSPNRQRKSEGNVTPRKSSATPAESPERPSTQAQPKEPVRRTPSRQKSVESIKNNKRESPERQTAIKKRDSKTKIEIKTEKSSAISGVKRKDSRETSTTTTSSKVEDQPRRALVDIEQKNLENREKTINSQGQKGEIISTNQTTLSELKSANVVMTTMRQSAVYSQEAVVTSQFSSTFSSGMESPKPNANTTITEIITKSPKHYNRASKSPERSDVSHNFDMSSGTTSNKKITVERRRSSNLEKKVEALMGNANKTPLPRTPSSPRMTTTELNAVDDMENIEELEILLDKAVDYDERSKIRARIRLLKRKATLVKRVSDIGSPERQPTWDEQKVDRSKSLATGTTAYFTVMKATSTITNGEISAEQFRIVKDNKVSSRKSSTELTTDKKVTSRKSSDELVKKSPVVDKENRVETKVEPTRASSPPKQDRRSPPTSTLRNRERKSPSPQRTVGSRSNSGQIIIKRNTTDTEKKVPEKESLPEEDKRRLSSETTELLSTRSYARDNEKQEVAQTTQTVTASSKITSVTTGESVTIQDHDLYSSRRSSRNLEEDKADVDKLRRTMAKTESATRLKQKRERSSSPLKSRSPSPPPKSSSRAASPQRSEIPISSRMKRERSLSPPKIAPKDTPSEVANVVEKPVEIKKVEEETAKFTEAAVQQQEKVESEATEITSQTAVSSPRKISTRKPSSELVTNDKQGKPTKSMTPERKVKPSRGTTKEEEEKYAADILSRPSVFAPRRAVAAKEASPVPVEKAEKESSKPKNKEPLPEKEIRKPREPSPEKEKDVELTPDTTTTARTTTLSQRTTIDSTKENSSRKVARGDSSKSLTSKVQQTSSNDAPPVPEDKEKVRKETVTPAKEKVTEDSATKRPSRNIPISRRSSSKELPKKSKDESVSQPSDNETPTSTKPSESTQATNTDNKTISVSASESSRDNQTSSTVSKSTSKSEDSRIGEVKTSSTFSRSSNITSKPVTSTTTSSNTSTRRSTPSSNKGKVTEKAVSTDMVTSSYGVGPTDDNGAPLFGLRALRKIKQVQEQQTEVASETQDVVEEQKESVTSVTTTTTVNNTTSSAFCSSQGSNSSGNVTSKLQSLRSNDMYGLRALRKQAAESRAETSDSEQSPVQKPLSTGSSSTLEKDKLSRTSPSKTTPATTTTSNTGSNTSSASLSSQNISKSTKLTSSEESANNAQTFSIKSIEREDDYGEDDEEMEAIITATETVSETVEESTSSSSMMTSNDSRKQSSPKSILKKTSSFSSNSIQKNSGNGGSWEELEQEQQSTVSSEALHPDSDDTSGDKTSSDISSSAAKSSSKTTSRRDSNSDSMTTEQRKSSGRIGVSQDDESWMRQRSHSPSPKLASSSTASSIATFSRGKVGRSSVKEMSRRFDDVPGEHISKSSSSTSLSSDMRSSVDRESSPSLASRGSRAESPSRIPLSIKSIVSMSAHGTTPSGTEIEKDITISEENTQNSKMAAVSTTTTESFETGGPIRSEEGEGEIRIQGSQQQKRQQRRFETNDGSISVTSNVVQTRVVTSSTTTSAGGRSFLNDQSPIQNLSDVIDRMRGEDPELMRPFNDDNTGEAVVIQGNNHGRNLLNKFIGAQVIMQAVEPMLIAQKVSMSMSSSLEQSGAEGEEAVMDSPTIKEMIDTCEEVEQSSKEQRVQSSSGGSASVEITEISSSSHSPTLIQQSSIASESGDQGRSATTTGECELMPLILDQLQSSLSSISSPAVIGGGAYHNGASATLSCHNLMGSQTQHHLSHSNSSHNSPYVSHSSDKSSSFGNKVVAGNNTALAQQESASALSSSFPPTFVNSSNTYNCPAVSPATNNIGGNVGVGFPYASGCATTSASVGSCDGGLQLGEEESSTSTGTSSEECLFDSGTESGEDLSTNVNGIAPTTGIEESSEQLPIISSSPLATPQLPTVVTIPSSAKSSVAESQLGSQYEDVASEFSCFIEGLKNSLKRNSKKESSLGSAYYNQNPQQREHSDTSSTSFLSQDQLGLGSGEVGSTEVVDSNRKFSVPDPAIIGTVGSSITSRVEESRGAAGEKLCATDDEHLHPSGIAEDAGLIQQVDKVLTLLRASLLKDPGCLAQIPANTDIRAWKDPPKGKELIALIDRLKSSLNVEDQQQHDTEKPFGLNPTSGVVPVSGQNYLEQVASSSGFLQNTGQSNMIGCAQPQYSDITKSSSNSWIGGGGGGIGDFSLPRNDFIDNAIVTSNGPPSMDYVVGNNQSLNRAAMVEHNNMLGHSINGGTPTGGNNPATMNPEQGEGVPWKIRLARRRSQPRSHTVGVTQEELAEARRLFEESTGFRFYARDPKQPQSIYNNMQDLSSFGNSGSVTGINNNNNPNNINNYKASDATVVGTVPAPSNPPRMFTSAESEPDNLPLSPTSIPYPHSSTSTQDEVTSQNMITTSGADNQKEILPSGGGGGCVSTSSWQTDVEKRLTSIPRPFVPFVKNATQFYEGYQPPPERRMTYASIDDSCPIVGGVIGNLKIKPFRTYSLDNNKTSSAQDDPSKTFFTPQESVQIAIHKAAIKKQMSEEEDRRKRRNSLSSYQASEAVIKPERNYALGMPKPYSPPQKQQQHVDYKQPSSEQKPAYETTHHPAYSAQSNGYSPFYQSGDSGYTEESGPESSGLHNKHDQSPANCYDTSLTNTSPPVSSSTSVMPLNANNGMVNISSTGNSGITSDTLVSSGNTITYTTTPSGNFLQKQQQQQSPQRIENVQISLKELSSSEFPQLQIAITLNTNNNSGSSPDKGATGQNGSPPAENVQNSLMRIQNTVPTTVANVTAQQGSNNYGSSNMGNARPIQMDMSNSNPYYSNDEGQQTSASASRAIRYKSKNERKKRLKRANTIDIPHPPGLLLHSNNNDDDDDSEMEDEEDSDFNYRSVKPNSSGVNNQTGKYQPFMAKTEGDKKFLAFLQKNNALEASRPLRPSYLGVNDRQWMSRFSNIKTSFESSSQGSSPSASPVPSPHRAPRSVSEMALSHGKHTSSSGESCSKPVWANSEKSQLPPQVRNKLHVFENKSFEGQPSDYPQWRSPHLPSGYQGGAGNQYGGNRAMMFPGMKQTVSTNALNQVRGGQPSRIYNRPVYSSHDNVNVAAVSQKKLVFQGNSFDSKLNEQQRDPNTVRKPTPVKPHQSFPNLPTEQPTKLEQNRQSKPANAGVHMVHATAAAMEAMKKSAFVPASVVPVQSVNQQISGSAPFPPVTKMVQDDKIELPWAKRSQDVSPSFRQEQANSVRAQSSKNRFEQPVPLPQGFPVSLGEAPLAKSVPPHASQFQPLPQPQQHQFYEQYGKRGTDISTNYPPAVSPNPPFVGHHQPTVTNTINGPQQVESGNAGMQRNAGFSSMGHSADEFVPVVRPPIKTFGVTQSFDEAFKKNLDQQISSGNAGYHEEEKTQIPFSTSPPKAPFPDNSNNSTGSQQDLSRFDNNLNSTKKPFEIQQSSGSAFASRSVPNAEVPVPQPKNEERAPVPQPDVVSGTDNVPGQEGLVLTPVVSKVMRGPQQQRATVMTNRMSTLSDDEQNTRLSSARSNLRNFLFLSTNKSPDPTGTQDKEIASLRPQGNTGSHNLSPLMKSASGDTLHISPSSPASINSVSPKELSRSPLNQPPPNAAMAGFNEQPTRPVIIPRQKSLSEFPKMAPQPRIEPLRVETDISMLTDATRSNRQATVPASVIPDRTRTKDVTQLQNKTIVQPQPQPRLHQQQQQQRISLQTSQSLHHHQQHKSSMQQQQSHQQRQLQIQQLQQVPQAAPKATTRSYPDSLQRTSSGSSIFNRAKNLFFGSQDGAPPSTKLRPKLPSTQAKLPFPKQFEAQMSPDSADRKQRELQAYFRQQQQEQELLQGSGISGGKLRKSASHSKIMHRQRSLSDGDEDVDAIFESLFKASVESKAIKSADAVSKSEISSSSISVECEQKEMKAASSVVSTSSSVSSSASSLTSSSVSSGTKIQTVSTSSISMQSQSMTRSALPATPVNKFKAMDQQANAGKKPGAPLFKFANEGLKASATSAKDILLYWCQCRTREYENVKIDNFSSSWSDGLAFCALIHHFYPDAFDYNSLNPRNRKYNFDLAFRIADEKAGIYPLLDTVDMVAMGTRPDWKCVFTYVQSMYQKLKDM